MLAAVYVRLREVYNGVAEANFSKVATLFNGAAKRFTTAASAADPEADAASMVSAPEKARRSWLDSESFGNEITRVLPALRAAATLAGVVDVDQDSTSIPLCCDPGGAHRRKVWMAWLTTTGRTGRWGALLKAGCVLRAAPLRELVPYAEPKPLEQRREPIAGSSAYRIVEHDPEDEGFTPEAIDPRRQVLT